MIDFHCHLDLYKNPAQILEETVCRRGHLLAVTTTPMAWEGTLALVREAPHVEVAVGLHPELVATRHKEVAQLCDLLSETDYVGEIGLDGTIPHQATLPIQRQVFEEVLTACEDSGGRVMSIHSRGATSLVLDYLETYARSGLPVMHWFSGTQSELKRAIDIGCWFSIGPAMIRGVKGRRLASMMPSDRVLTETDGPLAHRRNRPLMPWDVEEVELVLGNIWKLSPVAVQQQLVRNLDKLMDTIAQRMNV